MSNAVVPIVSEDMEARRVRVLAQWAAFKASETSAVQRVRATNPPRTRPNTKSSPGSPIVGEVSVEGGEFKFSYFKSNVDIVKKTGRIFEATK